MQDDICTLKAAPLEMELSRLIFASPSYRSSSKFWDGELVASFMLSDMIWNGCNGEETKWDCTLKHGLKLYLENLENSTDEYKAVAQPKDDWLVVTVDYHS